MEKLVGCIGRASSRFTLTNAWCHPSEQVERWRGRDGGGEGGRRVHDEYSNLVGHDCLTLYYFFFFFFFAPPHFVTLTCVQERKAAPSNL